MKVKERKIAKKGGYKAVFQELIRPDNKVSTKIGKDKKERILFRMVNDAGEQIPCGIVLDFKDQRTISAVASLGVDVVKMKELAEDSPTKALIYFEKAAKKKSLPCSVYVREDGSFGSAIHPWEAKIPVKFNRILSRDKETGLPIWTFKPGQQRVNRKTGGTYMSPDINSFDIGWVGKSGPYKGVLLKTSAHYAIVKDEDDEWIVDAMKGPGVGFKQLLVWHKIDPEILKPDKLFENPENGLPELEKIWKKRADIPNLEIVIEPGKWMNVQEKKSMDDDGTADTNPVDIGEEEFAADPELVNKLISMIDRRVKKEHGKSAWAGDGELSKVGRLWVNRNVDPIIEKKKMPGSFEEMSDDQVSLLIKLIKAKFPL